MLHFTSHLKQFAFHKNASNLRHSQHILLQKCALANSYGQCVYVCALCVVVCVAKLQVSVGRDASMLLPAPLVIKLNRFRGRITMNYSYMFACLSSQGAEWE